MLLACAWTALEHTPLSTAVLAGAVLLIWVGYVAVLGAIAVATGNSAIENVADVLLSLSIIGSTSAFYFKSETISGEALQSSLSYLQGSLMIFFVAGTAVSAWTILRNFVHKKK